MIDRRRNVAVTNHTIVMIFVVLVLAAFSQHKDYTLHGFLPMPALPLYFNRVPQTHSKKHQHRVGTQPHTKQHRPTQTRGQCSALLRKNRICRISQVFLCVFFSLEMMDWRICKAVSWNSSFSLVFAFSDWHTTPYPVIMLFAILSHFYDKNNVGFASLQISLNSIFLYCVYWALWITSWYLQKWSSTSIQHPSNTEFFTSNARGK